MILWRMDIVFHRSDRTSEAWDDEVYVCGFWGLADKKQKQKWRYVD